MTYQEELCYKINDIKKWPWFERLDFLTDLNAIADKMNSKETIEGYLASLLIYHQLCEEMIKKLIECSDFFIQCAIFPKEIKITDLAKKNMFGQLLNNLKSGVINQKIRLFIKKCENFNELRIEIVHKLTSKTSISEITKQAQSARKFFDEILNIFEKIYSDYEDSFCKYQKKSADEKWIESIINQL